MKAFIYTGGRIEPSGITEHPKSDDFRIAADSGYKNALALGEKIDLLIGDFDSYEGKLPDADYKEEFIAQQKISSEAQDVTNNI